MYCLPDLKIYMKWAITNLKKIFGYLHVGNELSSEYKWGLQQAQHFANEFAVKWVKINKDNMNADEIKLLVRMACYFEKKEEENF